VSRNGLSKTLVPQSRRKIEILAKALPPKALKVKRIMGEGSFGQVFEVRRGEASLSCLLPFLYNCINHR